MPRWTKVFVEKPGVWNLPASVPLKLVEEDVDALPEPGPGQVLLKHICGGLAWADTMMAGRLTFFGNPERALAGNLR